VTVVRTYTLTGEIEKIGEHAFEGSSVEGIEIPATVTEIKANAFANCKILTSVTFQTNSVLNYVGDRAFATPKFVSIELPATVTEIGAFCFAAEQNTLPSELKTVSLTGVETINEYAFYNCKKLTTVNAGAGLSVISVCAFRNCESLIDITNAPATAFLNAGHNAFEGSGFAD
ncbi:MAG: leucine-rich repeat domain-containing protein, partial [Clostridia bacterium]|nr:leucine-rich repeat domain-containing protein [Clostridia bacterium]